MNGTCVLHVFYVKVLCFHGFFSKNAIILHICACAVLHKNVRKNVRVKKSPSRSLWVNGPKTEDGNTRVFTRSCAEKNTARELWIFKRMFDKGDTYTSKVHELHKQEYIYDGPRAQSNPRLHVLSGSCHPHSDTGERAHGDLTLSNCGIR